jgi:hypothetical protein
VRYLFLISVLLVGCATPAEAPATPTPPPAPTASPMARLTPKPTPIPEPTLDAAIVRHVVHAIDELGTLSGTDALLVWAQAEVTWLTTNLSRLPSTPGSAYTAAIGELLAAMSNEGDTAPALASVAALREEFASLIGGVPTPTPSPTPTPAPTPKVYAKLTARSWALLVKDPDKYLGNAYQVWGCISQFDAATGNDSFRAQASYAKQAYWYSDGDNALFTGDADHLADFVADDVVRMNVVSLGSFSYDTQIGGSTTVPLFLVDAISRQGSCA